MFLASLISYQQQTISLDFEVGPIAAAVRKLSQVSGTPLSVEGIAKNETVFLHVENRPFQEVLDKIAKVTISQWKPLGNGGYTLVRPEPLIQQALAKESQQRLGVIKAWQSEVTKPLVGPFLRDLESKYTAELREHIKIKSGYRGTNPGKYIEQALLLPLYRECVRRIDPIKIASLKFDERVVFSSSPTPRQIAFVQPIASSVVALNRTLAAWRARLDKAGIKIKQQAVDPRRYEYSYFSGANANATLPFALPVLSIVLSFNSTSYNRIVVIMSLVDGKGRVVAALQCDAIDASLPKGQPASSFPELERIRVPIATLPTRALREASQDKWQIKPSDLTNPEISKALAPYFNDPVNNDFLKLGNQEFFSILGPAMKRSIVACIPDGQMLRYELASVRQFADAKVGESTSNAISENWIEFFPKNPVDHWRSRGNREALARCAKTWRENGTMTMRDVTQLLPMDANCYPNIQEFAQLMMPSARNRSYSAQVAYTNYSGMGTLLSSLTDSQIKQLLHGSKILYKDLSRAQRSYCEAIVYGVPFHRVIGGDSALPSGWEPTLELPNGLLDTMGITAQYIEEKYLLAHDGDEPPFSDLRETMELDERAERFNGAVLGCGNYARANRWMKFEFRTRRRFALRCYLTNGHYYSVDYYDPIQPDKGQRLTVDQLSPSLLAKILKMNRTFNSRSIKYIGKDGQTWMKTETYKQPKLKGK